MSTIHRALAPASPAPVSRTGAAASRRFPIGLALAVALPTLISLAGAAVLVNCPSAWDHGSGSQAARLEARSA